MEPACAFFQKAAVEKSISEIDKRLATEFDLRKHARNNGMRYYDSFVFANHVQSHLIWIRKTITPPPFPKKSCHLFQADPLLEPIRLKTSGVTAQQTAVYAGLWIQTLA